MGHTFKVGDKGKTRNGDDYEVLVVDAKGRDPIVANVLIDGLWMVSTFSFHGRFIRKSVSGSDLLPPKATRTQWLAMYRTPCGSAGMSVDHNRDGAVLEATRGQCKLIAIKEVTITEGEGMDE